MKSILNALRMGLENMGVQLPKFNFSLRPKIFDYRKKSKETKEEIFRKKIIHRKNGTDRR